MSGNSVVQVAPDSTGKKIRNLEREILLDDGSLATVQTQVVAFADDQGNLVGFSKLENLLARIADGLDDIYDYMKLHGG